MKKIIASIILGCLITSTIGIAYVWASNQSLCEKFVRVHIIANSDLDFDQNLKYKVRDQIFSEYQESFAKFDSKEKTLEFLHNNLSSFEEIAKRVIKENGANYDVKAYVNEGSFPQKKYDNFTLPSGEYSSLKIVIGNGLGKNFWCVMFPPLCVAPQVETVTHLDDVLTENEISEITKDTPNVKIKFKILEILNSL